jgi:hypothetical protein
MSFLGHTYVFLKPRDSIAVFTLLRDPFGARYKSRIVAQTGLHSRLSGTFLSILDIVLSRDPVCAVRPR